MHFSKRHTRGKKKGTKRRSKQRRTLRRRGGSVTNNQKKDMVVVVDGISMDYDQYQRYIMNDKMGEIRGDN